MFLLLAVFLFCSVHISSPLNFILFSAIAIIYEIKINPQLSSENTIVWKASQGCYVVPISLIGEHF